MDSEIEDAQSIYKLSVLGQQGESIFDEDKYVIPLYQRPYAWGEKEIEQLIEDIQSFRIGGNQQYCLGSLIVARDENEAANQYEVIDGQQRLTTLFLILDVLLKPQYEARHLPLSFSCRDKSNYTLENLGRLGKREELVESNLEESIITGRRIIKDKLSNEGACNDLKSKLKLVYLYRIEVPPHTDLNRYFEIMNTRGEQLEQHEILKARLMEPLSSGRERVKFAEIWDACSDMTGYIQMHFIPDVRKTLFCPSWDKIPTEDSVNSVEWQGSTREACSIDSILRRKGETSKPLAASTNKNGDAKRFESIIEFPYFLLHVLRVFVEQEKIEPGNGGKPITAKLLDDRELVSAFEGVLQNGVIAGRSIDRKSFSEGFILCLLRCRFAFDNCLIKREYANGDIDGAWSLKELKKQSSKEAPYYADTEFRVCREWKSTYESRNKSIEMIQACFRVSYTSPRVMHWITNLLSWLMNDNGLNELNHFEAKNEEIVKEAVRPFLQQSEHRDGVNTEHIVFNYLDFLLWKKSQDKSKEISIQGAGEFVFEFRTSVEHWYPQHPSEGTFPKWDDVDRFGNLCIIQRNVNSKFSNLEPLAKKSTYKDAIAKGSLKLRLMSDATDNAEDWETRCEEHEKKMLDILNEALDEGTKDGI